MSIPQTILDEFSLIRAAFESGSIKKMSQLAKQKPSRIAELMGMNVGRYGAKLLKPEDFSPSEIIRFSIVLDIDPGLVINVIMKERLEQETNRILFNIQRLKNKKG